MNNFEENFLAVIEELESLNKTFVIKNAPKEYQKAWTPNGEVRLWSIPRTSGEILKSLVLARRPNSILELGTSAGYSTLWLASAARSYGGKVYTVEIVKPKIEMARSNFKKARLENFIKQIEGNISDVLTRWSREPVDFVFLDADKKNYLSYLKQIESIVSDNAVIVADNVIDFKDYINDYLDYLSKNAAYRNCLIEVDHGLMVSLRSSSKTGRMREMNI